MAIIESIETQINRNPARFAIAEPTKLLTFIKGEPPVVLFMGIIKNENPLFIITTSNFISTDMKHKIAIYLCM